MRHTSPICVTIPSPLTWKAGDVGGAPGLMVVTWPAVTWTVTLTLTTITMPSSTSTRVSMAGETDT